MNENNTSLVASPAWQALTTHRETIRDVHLRELFQRDSQRGERLNAEAVDIFLDYSKNRITDETLQLLLELADQCRLHERIDAMFGGERINLTENRSVLHVALRGTREPPRSWSMDRTLYLRYTAC